MQVGSAKRYAVMVEIKEKFWYSAAGFYHETNIFLMISKEIEIDKSV